MSETDYRLPNGVVWQELDGEVLLISPGKYATWVLNQSGAQVWQSLCKHKSLPAIARELARACGGETGAALQMLRRFLHRLRAAGLVECVGQLAEPETLGGVFWMAQPPSIAPGTNSRPKRRGIKPMGGTNPWE